MYLNIWGDFQIFINLPLSYYYLALVRKKSSQAHCGRFVAWLSCYVYIFATWKVPWYCKKIAVIFLKNTLFICMYRLNSHLKCIFKSILEKKNENFSLRSSSFAYHTWNVFKVFKRIHKIILIIMKNKRNTCRLYQCIASTKHIWTTFYEYFN